MLSFSLGTCRIKLRFSCFALLAFCCLFAGIAGGAFLLSAVLLHEAAHIAAMCFLHAPPLSAELSALGCRIILDPQKRLTYRENILVSLAGPSVNLLSFFVMAVSGMPGHLFASASLTLGILHSLPVEPLDGGLALHAFLSERLDPVRAGKLSFAVSLTVLFPLAVLGFLVLLYTRYNFSLLALSLYLMLYLVLKRDYLGD